MAFENLTSDYVDLVISRTVTRGKKLRTARRNGWRLQAEKSYHS